MLDAICNWGQELLGAELSILDNYQLAVAKSTKISFCSGYLFWLCNFACLGFYLILKHVVVVAAVLTLFLCDYITSCFLQGHGTKYLLLLFI